MRLFLTILTVLFITATFFSAEAQQNEPERVQAVIEQLFDGMRESDSTKVSAAFTKDAIMQTVVENEAGEVQIRSGNLQAFLNAIGTEKEEIWDERISAYDINIDGELATVWTPYQFYVGDEFSHCGVNSFQLIKKNGSWQIFFIVDTRRQDNCN
ncbi:MAG: nuclear transport factor 2 family protein [Gracilimonas sp.]